VHWLKNESRREDSDLRYSVYMLETRNKIKLELEIKLMAN
jgi:hypothetical protein